MTEASLFRKNLIFLDAAQPGVASLVRRSTDTITRAVPGGSEKADPLRVNGCSATCGW